MNNDFYTLTTYIHNKEKITYPMEDYLEMIYRNKDNKITITSLSKNLNIKKSSCSKMISKLKILELVSINNNNIILTPNGIKIGAYLYHRHQILETFLKNLNKEQFCLEQVEKLEHFIDETTLTNLEKQINKDV
ncbi:transcriptional regulator MntR (Manganese transport regulator) [Mycoplasma sp. CAG:776]|nr:transcriptional regulator MntR (Manganese transport regulator) [Mycoplasma sp. CAG:776]